MAIKLVESSRIYVAIVEVNNIGTLIRPDLSNFRQLIVPSTKEKRAAHFAKKKKEGQLLLVVKFLYPLYQSNIERV